MITIQIRYRISSWVVVGQVLLGDSGQFAAEFRGVPAPRVTWLVSGTEITETDKYHIEIAESLTRLNVAETTADDANVAYTCQITSAAGQATSTARFVILGNRFPSRRYIGMCSISQSCVMMHYASCFF